MVMKFGRTGQFLGCSKYPECKATRPLGGQPRVEAVASEHLCPKCGKTLMIRENKRGEKFLSCAGYPECKESFNIDPQGNPVRSVVETEYVCEKCGKPMALRQGSRGAFLGCTGYPKCRNALQVDDQGKPIPAVKVEINCEKCGKPMAVRRGRRGSFLGCTNYPKCRGTAQIPDELKEQLAEQPAPAQAAAGTSPATDLKAIPIDVTCDDCGGPMLARRGRRGFFLGCAGYPKCKGTKQADEATLAKINEVVGAPF
jgi:DNA topoisomerase-1